MALPAKEPETNPRVFNAKDYVYTDADRALIEGAKLMPQVAQGTGGAAISAFICRFHRSAAQYYKWDSQRICVGWGSKHETLMYCPVTD